MAEFIQPSQPGSSTTLARYIKLFTMPSKTSLEDMQLTMRKFKSYIETLSPKKESFLVQIGQANVVPIFFKLWNHYNQEPNLQLTILQTVVALVRADKESTRQTSSEVYRLFSSILVDILETCVNPSDGSFNSFAYFSLCAELLDSHCSGKAGKPVCEAILRDEVLKGRLFALIQTSVVLPSAQAQLFMLLLGNRLMRYSSKIGSGIFATSLGEITSFIGISKELILKISSKPSAVADKIAENPLNHDFRKIAFEVRLQASKSLRSKEFTLDLVTPSGSADLWVEASHDLTTAGVFSFSTDQVSIEYQKGISTIQVRVSYCDHLDLSILGIASCIFVSEKGGRPIGSLTSVEHQNSGSTIIFQHPWPQVVEIHCDVAKKTISFETISDKDSSTMTHGILFSSLLLREEEDNLDKDLKLKATFQFSNEDELGHAIDCIQELRPFTVKLTVSSRPKSKKQKLLTGGTSDSYVLAEAASRAAGGASFVIKPKSSALAPSLSDIARSKLGIKKPRVPSIALLPGVSNSEIQHLTNLGRPKSSKSLEVKSVAIPNNDGLFDNEQEEEVDPAAMQIENNKNKNDEVDEAKNDEVEDKDKEEEIAGDALKDEQEGSDEDLTSWQAAQAEIQPQTSLTQAPIDSNELAGKTSAELRSDPADPAASDFPLEHLEEQDEEEVARDIKEKKNKEKKKTIASPPLPHPSNLDDVSHGRPLRHTRLQALNYNEDSQAVKTVPKAGGKRARNNKQDKVVVETDQEEQKTHDAKSSSVPKGRIGQLNLVTGSSANLKSARELSSKKSSAPSSFISNLLVGVQKHPETLPESIKKSNTAKGASMSSARASAMASSKPIVAAIKGKQTTTSGEAEFDFEEEDEDKNKKEDDGDEEEEVVKPSSAKKAKSTFAEISVPRVPRAEIPLPLSANSSAKFVTPAIQVPKTSKAPVVKLKTQKSRIGQSAETTQADNALEFNEVDKKEIHPSRATTDRMASNGPKSTGIASIAKSAPIALQASKKRTKEASPSVAETNIDEEDNDKEEEDEDKDDIEAKVREEARLSDARQRKRIKTEEHQQEDLIRNVDYDGPLHPSIDHSIKPPLAPVAKKSTVPPASKGSRSSALPLPSAMKKTRPVVEEEVATKEKPIALESAFSGGGIADDGSQRNQLSFGLEDSEEAVAAPSPSSPDAYRQMSEQQIPSESDAGNDFEDDDDIDKRLDKAVKDQCREILAGLSKTLDHQEKRLLAKLERDEFSDLGISQSGDTSHMTLDDARDTIPNYVEAIEKAITRSESTFKAGTAQYNSAVAECEGFLKKQAASTQKLEAMYRDKIEALNQSRIDATSFSDSFVKSTIKAAEKAVAESKAKEAALVADHKRFTEKLKKKERLSAETIRGFF